MPSTVTRGLSDEQSQTYPNNAFDAEYLLLATTVHEALLPAIGNRDRGVRRARFPGVLRNQHCPAILIEGGYLSNLQEARKIDTPAFRQKLAQAVADALAGKPSLGTARTGSADSQMNAVLLATH
jgi:N-acetylmuramoyl-L-alanine amidase